MKRTGKSAPGFPRARRVGRTAALLTACLALLPRLFAEDSATAFVIAPPPVGYPEFAAGETVERAGVNGVYLTLDRDPAGLSEGLTLLGGSAFVNRQASTADYIAVELDAAGTFLAGNRYGLMAFNVPLGVNLILKPLSFAHASLFAFGGFAGTMGLTVMSFDIDQPVPLTSQYVTDTVTVTSVTFTGTLSGGLQCNLRLSPFVLSPFALWSVTGGRYMTDLTGSMSYDYPSDGGDIGLAHGSIYGFDIMHEPSHVSLSSMLKQDKGYTMVTVTLKFTTARYKDGERIDR